jgi:UDP-2-acetamido-2,6-beta-L-arabino-hexul-4-ose reductase
MFDKPFEEIQLESHPDKRGNLFEVLQFKDQNIPAEGHLYTLSIMPGARRGDHYHEHKREWFTCVWGECVILAEEKNGTKHKVLLSAEHPSLLYFAPYTAHTLINVSSVPAVLVSYGSTQYDPVNPDQISKIIEYEGF